MTSCAGENPVLRAAGKLVGAAGRVHVFDRDEITGALARYGLVDIEQQVSGVAQFVSARRPD